LEIRPYTNSLVDKLELYFQILPWVVAALCLAWYIPQAQANVNFFHKGDGLTSYHWEQSQIIQAVNTLPKNQAVISNDWQLLLLWTGRPIYGVWVSSGENCDFRQLLMYSPK